MASTPGEWTPWDLITTSAFCPSSTFQRNVDQVARSHGADCLAVVPFSDFVIFQSLITVAGRSPLANRLRSIANTASFAFHTPLSETQLLGELQRFPKLGRITRSVQALQEFGAAIHTEPYTIAIFGADLRPERAKLFCLSAAPSVFMPSDRTVRQLLGMVNATQQVAVHQEHFPLSRVGRLLSHRQWLDSASESTPAIGELLRLALEVSEADGAALYTASPKREGGFDRRHHVTAVSGLTAEPRADALDTQTPAGVARTGRPHIRTLSNLSDPDAPTDWRYPGQVRAHELVIPIQDMPGGRQYPFTAYLSVIRISTGPFGPYELALLRNVSLRLAILTRSLDAERTASLTAEYLKVFDTGVHATLPLRRSSATSDTTPGRAVDDPLLPPDMAGAASDIANLLAILSDVTRCTSVTVRAVCPPRGEERGPTLRRVAVWPADDGEETADPVIHLTDRLSVNAWVARTGTPCHLADVSDPRAVSRYPALGYKRFRRRTKSELCVPLHIDGWLVGTVNIESDRVNNFVLKVDQSALICQMIALAVVRQRLRTTRALEAAASRVDAYLHDLHKAWQQVQGLREMTDLSESAEARVMAISDYLEQVVAEEESGVTHDDLAEGGPSHQQSVGPMTLSELLRNVIAAVELNIRIPEVLPPGPSLHGERLAIAESALQDILQNIYNYASPSTPVRLERQGARLGGRQLTLFRLRYATSQPVDSRLPAKLFRVPVEAGPSARLHLGSYLAGRGLRSVGLDVYFTRLSAFVAAVTVVGPNGLS